MKKTFFIALALLVMLSFVGCKTAKKLPKSTPKSKIEQFQATSKPNKTTKKPVAKNPYSAYRWVSYRGAANIQFDGKKYQCNYVFVNRIDSIIYLNINLMGIELARLVATPQKVTFVNKMSNEYYDGDYAFVEKYLKAKADFYTLQALFNGNKELLKTFTGIEVEYNGCLFPSIDIPFFDKFRISMNNGTRKVDATVTNLKFNVPGSTGIKIPTNAKAMKL